MKQWLLSIIVLVCISQPISAKFIKKFVDHNTGASGSLNPTIPEPMIFDLVRPLGAEKGEIEINTLIEGAPSRSSEFIKISPEIEFVLINGLAFEFEMPLSDHEIDEFKIAAQKTFNRDREKKFIHGWQTITRYEPSTNFSFTNLYISGYRFNKRWSALAMNGIRNNQIGKDLNISPLANLSVFRHISPSLKLGIETNYAFSNITSIERYNRFLVMPQVHYELGHHYSIQVGAGLERYEEARYSTVISMRLIKEF
jgi:hypothetical protein